MNSKKVWKSLLVFSFLMGGLLTASYGQFAKGTKAAGGSLGIYKETDRLASGQESSRSSFGLQLNGGYFFKKNLEAGMRLGIQAGAVEQERRQGMVRISSSTFEVGPYGRAYYTVTDVVGLFGEAGLLLGFGGESTGARIRTFEMGVRPGVILMVNENLGLEAKLGFMGYQHRAVGDSENFADTKEVRNVFRAGIDLSAVSFGFRLYLGN